MIPVITIGQRTCECGCGTSLDGRRSDAKFTSDACRMAHRRQVALTDGIPLTVLARFWERYKGVRRRHSPNRGRTDEVADPSGDGARA